MRLSYLFNLKHNVQRLLMVSSSFSSIKVSSTYHLNKIDLYMFHPCLAPLPVHSYYSGFRRKAWAIKCKPFLVAKKGAGPWRSMRREWKLGTWYDSLFYRVLFVYQFRLQKHWQETMTTDLKTNYDAEMNTSDVEKTKNCRKQNFEHEANKLEK